MGRKTAVQITFDSMTTTVWNEKGILDEYTEKFENFYLLLCWNCNTPVCWQKMGCFWNFTIEIGAPYPDEFEEGKRYKYEPNSPLCTECTKRQNNNI